MGVLTIGQVAKLAGVGVETVRFYEREGLILQPERPPSGYRQYPPEVVRRIRFIRRAKGLGFTLREIKELLELRDDSNSTCADVRKRAQEKIADIERRIADLKRIRTALVRLTERCEGALSGGECPFLEALDEQGEPGRREIGHKPEKASRPGRGFWRRSALWRRPSFPPLAAGCRFCSSPWAPPEAPSHRSLPHGARSLCR